MAQLPQRSSSPPGVSIVIPAYNYAHFLPQAIESALQQSYPNREIIVVDDGSTDNTAEVVKRYNERVRYIHQKNSGLPAARNTGIKNARSEFVAFLDADDAWLPEMLARSMETFSGLSEDFAMVACRAVLVDAGGGQLNLKRLLPDQSREITCRDLILKNRFSPSTVIARRSAFDDSGFFDETLRSSEDRDMWIRIAARHRIFLQHERLVLVRRHASSMSRHADRMKTNIRTVIGKAWEGRCASRADIFFWLRVFSFFRYQTAWMFFEENRRCEAFRDILFSILLWPFFAGPEHFNEPRFFRLRSLKTFFKSQSATPSPSPDSGTGVSSSATKRNPA